MILVFSILFDEKYFVYRSIIPNYKKNNGIKGSSTLMKVTGEQSTVLSFLGFSRNVSGQKLIVYHILILIHRGAKLYSQRRVNLKILKFGSWTITESISSFLRQSDRDAYGSLPHV